MPHKHVFTSAVADDPDTTLVQASDWNDFHTTPRVSSGSYTSQANSCDTVESDYEISSGDVIELASGSIFAIN
jgi:hypothetical protein